MKTLRFGSVSPDVKRWEQFLTGQRLFAGAVDEVFDQETHDASMAFQALHNLKPDGVVGNNTIAKAMSLGFPVIEDDSDDKYGHNWPSAPSFQPLVGNTAREKIFGKFKYMAKPIKGNPENIDVDDSWEKENIIQVHIPQLVGIKGAPKSGNIDFNRKAATQLVKLFADWQSAGLMHLVKTWNGSYVPRFVRGSNTTLSNHSFGTAFDINVRWNPLGTAGALVGEEGSVRELVPLANENGFYWGGHYKTRPDAMHFEVAILK